jgi:hypothetical protein
VEIQQAVITSITNGVARLTWNDGYTSKRNVPLEFVYTGANVTWTTSAGDCGGNDADPGGGNLGSVEVCQAACNENDLCIGFLWNTNEGGDCWLKTACTPDGSSEFDFYAKPAEASCTYGPLRGDVMTTPSAAAPAIDSTVAATAFTGSPLAQRTYSIAASVEYTAVQIADDTLAAYESRWELCLQEPDQEIVKNGIHVVDGVGPGSPLIYVAFLGNSGACLPSQKQDGVFAEAIKLFRLEGAATRCTEMPGSFPDNECRGDYTGGEGGGKFQISECLASGFGECAASCGGTSRGR